MYKVKFTVGGIGRLLPVATSLLVLGLFVIWTAAAHSQGTPQAGAQSDPPAAQAESGRKQFSQSCAFCHGAEATGGRGADRVRSTLVAHGGMAISLNSRAGGALCFFVARKDCKPGHE